MVPETDTNFLTNFFICDYSKIVRLDCNTKLKNTFQSDKGVLSAGYPLIISVSKYSAKNVLLN